MLGLSIGVALVITISSLSRGLDHAQKTALNPLSSIGTDLTVTLAPTQPDAAAAAWRRRRRRRLRRRRLRRRGGQVVQANAVGDHRPLEARQARHALRPRLLPARHAADVPAGAGAADHVAPGRRGRLVGPRPERRAPGGHGAEDRRQAQDGRPAADRHRPRALPADAGRADKIRACVEKLQASRRRRRRATPTPGDGRGRRAGSAAAAAGGGGARLRPRRVRASACRRRCANFRRTVTTPQQTIQQIVNPPQTNIKSSSYSIAGVDPTQPAIGLVTPSLLSSGRFLDRRRRGARRRLLREPAGLKLGSTLDLNGTKLKVVGLVKPPLGGQTADVYIPLAKLQALAGQKHARERGARPGDERHVGRRGPEGDRAEVSRTRRSRARRTSRRRSAARSSTRRTSRTGSASRLRSSPPSPRSCSRRC